MLRFAFHRYFKPICLRLGLFLACRGLILDHFLNNVSTISIYTFQSVVIGQNFLDLTLICGCPLHFGKQGVQGLFPANARCSDSLSAHSLLSHLCSQCEALAEKATELSRTKTIISHVAERKNCYLKQWKPLISAIFIF